MVWQSPNQVLAVFLRVKSGLTLLTNYLKFMLACACQRVYLHVSTVSKQRARNRTQQLLDPGRCPIIPGSTWNYPPAYTEMTEQKQTTSSAEWQVGQLLSALLGYTQQQRHSQQVSYLLCFSASTLMERRNGNGPLMTTSALQEKEEGLRGQDCCNGGVDEVVVVIGRFGRA